MPLEDDKKICYLIRNGLTCAKSQVAKKHLPYYECEKCIWRIHSEDAHHLNSLKRLFDKYSNKRWD